MWTLFSKFPGENYTRDLSGRGMYEYEPPKLRSKQRLEPLFTMLNLLLIILAEQTVILHVIYYYGFWSVHKVWFIFTKVTSQTVIELFIFCCYLGESSSLLWWHWDPCGVYINPYGICPRIVYMYIYRHSKCTKIYCTRNINPYSTICIV